MFTYKATIEKVVDGDTIDVSIDLGFDIWHKTRLRLAGIDAAEHNTKFGKAVKAFMTANLEGKLVTITTTKPDKYGRYLATVYLNSQVSVNDQLIIDGLAKKYDGSSKIGMWTMDELNQTNVNATLE